MSIKTLDRVWDKSKAAGSHLLLQLALADYCNDEDTCWPGLDALHGKARVTKRQVQRLVDTLVEHGELHFRSGGNGPGNTNKYLVASGLTEDEIKKRLISQFKMTEKEALERATSMTTLMAKPWPVKRLSKVDIQGVKVDIQGSQMAQNHAQSVLDPSFDPSLEPSYMSQEKPATDFPLDSSTSDESKKQTRDYLDEELGAPISNPIAAKAKESQAIAHLAASGLEMPKAEVVSLPALYGPAARNLLFTLQVQVGRQSPESLPPDVASKRLGNLVDVAREGLAGLKSGEAVPRLLEDLSSLNAKGTPAADVVSWLKRVSDDTKDAQAGAGPAVAAPRPAPVAPSAITKIELESTTVDSYVSYYERRNSHRILHIAVPGEDVCLCGRSVASLLPFMNAGDGLTTANYQSDHCKMCSMKFDRKPGQVSSPIEVKPEAKIEPEEVVSLPESKAEVSKTAAASASVLQESLFEVPAVALKKARKPKQVKAPKPKFTDTYPQYGDIYALVLKHGFKNAPDVANVSRAGKAAKALVMAFPKITTDQFARFAVLQNANYFPRGTDTLPSAFGLWVVDHPEPVLQPKGHPDCPICHGEGMHWDHEKGFGWVCDYKKPEVK